MYKTKMVVCSAIAAVALTACGQGSGDKQGETGGSGEAAPAPAKDIATLVRDVSAESRDKGSAKMDMKITAAGQDVNGTGSVKLGAPLASDVKFTGKNPTSQAEVIVLGDVTYLRNLQGSSSGKPWVKLDPKQNNPLAKLFDKLSQPSKQYADPGKMLGQLAAGGKLTKTSREELNGQQTTHYTVRVDTAKLAEQQRDPELKKLMQLLAKTGVTNYPVDMWVNGDNLPVQFKTVVPQPDLSRLGGQQGKSAPKIGPTTVTIRYHDWGKPVDIKAPPANQVGELPDLGKLGGAKPSH